MRSGLMNFKDIRLLTPHALNTDALGEDLADVFRVHPHVTLCPIADKQGFLLGCVPRNNFLRQITGQFGRALYDKKPVTKFMSQTVQIRSIHENLKDLLSEIDLDRSEVLRDGIALVDDDQRYVGILPGLRILSQMHELHSEMVTALQKEVVERKSAEARVRELANTDPLTGVLNRRAFREAIDTAMDGAASIGCAYLDLDGFKSLNDQYGHSIGDAMLSTVATRLKRLADTVLVSRLGGDEFAFVATNHNTASFKALCQRAHRDICAPKMTESGQVQVGVSIGWSLLPDDAESISAMIHNADKAMLQIKTEGGGVARFHPDHLGARAASGR
ncbi:MAG: GGDEF domain-containing protein [Pseudomonadota bacterium]